ncbi:MAG: histidine kinase [Desulfobacterales bacterium]|jgi:signal transduction histidine kinase|nr:histidine kinase [Desulfobacterales bacterium]
MKIFSAASLRTRLYLLVLAAFIPVCILLFYTAEEQKAIETNAILNNAILLAHSAANEEHQQLEATRHLLIAASEFLLQNDAGSDRTEHFFDDLIKESRGYVDLGVLTPHGKLLNSVRGVPPFKGSEKPAWFVRCITEKIFTMGDYKVDQITQEPMLYFALPVLDKHRQVKAAVFAAITLNWINRSIYRSFAELPQGSTLIQIDDGGDILIYKPHLQKWIKQDHFDRSLLQWILKHKTGIKKIIGEDGVSRIYAFAPAPSSLKARRHYISLEIPQKIAFAASQRVFFRNIILLGFIAILAVLIIWWAGDALVLRRVNMIVKASRMLAEGDLATRVGPIRGGDEISHLARVFNDMAAALELREVREYEAKEALERSREQLRDLASYLQDVREQERTRIAREIHDDFGQSLTILKMDLSWLKKHMIQDQPQVQNKIDAMFKVIDTSLQTLHVVSSELRPVILDDFGLESAIEWQAEEFQKRTGVRCRVYSSVSNLDLTKDQSTAIFRIFQETLTNIMRHAGATKVDVRLEINKDTLTLEVADNGRGITETEIGNSQSFGLLGIRERLYPLNGQVDFIGHPNKGTRVIVRVPIPIKGGAE